MSAGAQAAPPIDQIARPLHSGFLRSVRDLPERPALEVDGRELSYADLHGRAAALAATLASITPADAPPLTAVLAYRSATAFAGVLGALLRGHGYVPLNPGFPPDRTRLMIERSGARALVVDAASASGLEQVLSGLERSLTIVLPDVEDTDGLQAALPEHLLVGAPGLRSGAGFEAAEPDPGAVAYLMFTSGSTGAPKGVMVTHANVNHYVDVLGERYAISSDDRFSQTAELTFDNSVLDLFLAWEHGACVCCPSRKSLISPGRYIRDSRLTIWFSVPSTAIFMRRLNALKPGSYPTLRWSMFAGEALPAEVCEAWVGAAPNTVVENLYGPTEVTVDCLAYRWDPVRSPAECVNGVVPIGQPLPGMSAVVVDSDLVQVEPGSEGELLVAGPQVSLGYLADPERTAAAFVTLAGRDGAHYRTGDLVRRPAADGGPVPYLGRIDHQVQIFGERVELGEIESALRAESGTEAVVAVGWPVTTTGAAGIEAFVGDDRADAEALRLRLRDLLPGQMAPRRVHVLAELPLNDNGKFDRKALIAMLEDDR